jgi:predicted Zn-dependent protease
MRASLFAAACAASLALGALAGCTTNPATGERVFAGMLSESQEISIGRQQHPEIVKAFGGEYGSPELQRYIASVGQLLARTVERRDLEYTFTIVNSGIVNAFALPGGYIYVSRGLLALAENEAEVAGVLAHELGHVNALHHGRRQGQELLANVLVMGAGIAAGSAGQQVAQLGSVLAAGVLSSYSREHEREADTLGLRYMSRAGYDPQAFIEFLRKMRDHARLEAVRRGKSPDEVDATNYLATHPAPSERVERASAEAANVRVQQPMLAGDIYLGKIDGMLYGDDPDQGFIRGQVFAHPKLRFRFEVPEGFTLFNSPQAVTAQGPDGAAFVFDSAPKPSDGPVRFYLTDVWGRGAALDNVETLQINGLEAATATTRARTGSGPREARLVAIRKDLQSIYRFVFLTPPGQAERWATPFRRTTYSFRVLTESEAAALKPLRIRVVHAAPGDTVQSLARRMAGDDRFAAEQFRVLNGLRGDQAVRPGENVKIVTE